KSKDGLRRLSQLQNLQENFEVALKTRERVLELGPEADDYVWIANLHRSLRRFDRALEAADQAIKLEEENSEAHFERGCALAQLGRKQEALTAIKRAVELDPDTDLTEDDLKPLSKLPEFKTLQK